MKKLSRLLLFFSGFIFITVSTVWAQNQARIDKLLQSLADATPTEQIKIYNDLAFQHRTIDSKKTIEFCQKAIALADSVGYELELPRSYNFIGLAYYNNSNYLEALKYFDIGTEKAIAYKDSTELGFSYQCKAGVYRWIGEFHNAIENAINAESIFEKTGDNVGLAYTYHSFAGLYLDQHEPERALKFSQDAVNIIITETGNEKGLPTFMLTKADVLANLQRYDEAFKTYEDALGHYEREGHQRGIMIANIRMGKMFLDRGNHKTAKERMNNALSIHLKYGLNTELTSLYMLAGKLHLAENEVDLAKQELLKAEAFASKTNRRQELSEIFRMLGEIYEKKDDFPKALAYFKSHSLLKDSLFTENASKTIGKLESKIELAEKQDEVNLLHLEKAKSDEKLKFETKLRIFMALIALLMFCMAIVVLWHYRSNKKTNILLTKKNEQINKQSSILEEQARELTDAQKGLKETNEKLEEKVKLRTEELYRSNSELERFAFIASHDMKEPLRTITSFSQLLKRELDSEQFTNKKVNDYLQYIISGTRNMNFLVQDLLLYSKLKDSPEEPYTVVQFERLINTVLKNLDTQIKTNDVELYFKNLPTEVYGIEVMLVQLFQNLISNAIKFRKKDESCIVELIAKEDGDYRVFSVIDNGIGIDPKYHKRVFELFRKLHSRMVYEGSGIGLSICKRIVELHEGEIWLESKPGKGTAFHFSIPKVPNTDAKLEVITEDESNSGSI